MKEITLQTQITACTVDELDAELRQLVEIAKQKTQDAYCPYSHFHVGAAALLNDGTIITGANQENAAYPSGICAERTALFAANANHPHTPVKALAIACYTNGHFTKQAGTPCGACRQVMLETEKRFGKPMKILLCSSEEVYIVEGVTQLLPFAFSEIS